MGHKHSRDEILAGAVETAFRDGLSQLTFGRVAKHLGINDRTVVYYFPTKDDLIGEVLASLGARLQQTLAPALHGPVADHVELLRAAWPVLATDEHDDVFSLFFEASGLAVAGREPYATAISTIVGIWTEWTAEFVAGDQDHRQGEAETAVAVLDGLLLLRLLHGPASADRAARRLGIA